MIQLTDIESRMPDLHLGRHLSEVAEATHVGQRSRPRRWPLALLALIAGAMAVWTLVRNDTVRLRASAVASQVRSRTSRAMVGAPSDGLAAEPALAFPAAATAASTADLLETPWDQGSDDPSRIGSNEETVPNEHVLSPVGARSGS
jgi:hypothetical protein